jgi:hypothetical protein
LPTKPAPCQCQDLPTQAWQGRLRIESDRIGSDRIATRAGPMDGANQEASEAEIHNTQAPAKGINRWGKWPSKKLATYTL